MGSEARISTELLPTRIKIHPGGRADPRNFAPLHQIANVHEALGRRLGCQVRSYVREIIFEKRKFEGLVFYFWAIHSFISESRVLLHGYYPNSAEGAKEGPPESHIGFVISTPID